MQLRLTRTLALFPLLLLASCARSPISTPVAPTPPQVVVANAVNLLAQSLPVVSSSIIAERDQGKLSPENTLTAQLVIASLARAGKQINEILRSPAPWPEQRNQIIIVVPLTNIQTAVRNLPPVAAALMNTSILLFQQIVAAVGPVGVTP